MGTALDEIDARNEARVQQAVYAQRAGETSLQEVLAMSNAGLGDEVITRHLRTHGFNRELDAGDLIALRQQGVSDRVITALQEATASTLRMAPAAAPAPLMMSAPAVIVEERYHAMPYPWYPRRHYRRGCPGPPGPGFHWGVTFGH